MRKQFFFIFQLFSLFSFDVNDTRAIDNEGESHIERSEAESDATGMRASDSELLLALWWSGTDAVFRKVQL